MKLNYDLKYPLRKLSGDLWKASVAEAVRTVTRTVTKDMEEARKKFVGCVRFQALVRGYLYRKGKKAVETFVAANKCDDCSCPAKYEGLCKDGDLDMDFLRKHTPSAFTWESLCCYDCERVQLLRRKWKNPNVGIYDEWYCIEHELVCPDCKFDLYPRCDCCDELFRTNNPSATTMCEICTDKHNAEVPH